MKPKKTGNDSTSKSGKVPSGEGRQYKKKKEWFHDSSQTESNALRAMMGKQKKKDNDSKKSENDNDEQ